MRQFIGGELGLSNDISNAENGSEPVPLTPGGAPRAHIPAPRPTPLPTGQAFAEHRAHVMRNAVNYSRFVRTMKFVLPLTAFAIVAATLLFVMLYDADDSLTLSFTAVQAVDDDLRMVNPRFSGVDESRRPFLVTAASATQDVRDPRTINLESLQADLTLTNNGWVSMSADTGVLDTEAETIHLSGSISLYSDSGYEFHTNDAFVRLEDQQMVTNAPVRGQGPLGLITADRLTATDAGDRIRFEGNVRMRIYPPSGGN